MTHAYDCLCFFVFFLFWISFRFHIGAFEVGSLETYTYWPSQQKSVLHNNFHENLLTIIGFISMMFILLSFAIFLFAPPRQIFAWQLLNRNHFFHSFEYSLSDANCATLKRKLLIKAFGAFLSYLICNTRWFSVKFFITSTNRWFCFCMHARFFVGLVTSNTKNTWANWRVAFSKAQKRRKKIIQNVKRKEKIRWHPVYNYFSLSHFIELPRLLCKSIFYFVYAPSFTTTTTTVAAAIQLTDPIYGNGIHALFKKERIKWKNINSKYMHNTTEHAHTRSLNT